MAGWQARTSRRCWLASRCEVALRRSAQPKGTWRPGRVSVFSVQIDEVLPIFRRTRPACRLVSSHLDRPPQSVAVALQIISVSSFLVAIHGEGDTHHVPVQRQIHLAPPRPSPRPEGPSAFPSTTSSSRTPPPPSGRSASRRRRGCARGLWPPARRRGRGGRNEARPTRRSPQIRAPRAE